MHRQTDGHTLKKRFTTTTTKATTTTAHWMNWYKPTRIPYAFWPMQLFLLFYSFSHCVKFTSEIRHRNTSTNKFYTTSYSPKAVWESNDLSKLMFGDLFTESDRNSGWVQLRLMLQVKIDAWCHCIFHYLFKWLRGRNNGRAERNNIPLPGPAGIFMTKTMDVPSGIFFFPWAFSAAKGKEKGGGGGGG